MRRIRVFLLVTGAVLLPGLLSAFLSGGRAADAALPRAAICVAPPANLLAWYALDETSGTVMNDLSGTYDGTYQNNPAINAGQYVLNSRRFDGVNQYGEVPSGPDFGVGDFTIDAWINLTSTSLQILLDKRDVTPVGYMVIVNDGRLGLHLADASGFTNYFMNSPVLLNDGQWHFVAVTVQRTGAYLVTLWIDDLSQSFANNPRTGNLNSVRGLRLARNWPTNIDPGDHYFNGSLDEVELFNRALSDIDLASIRMAGPDGKCKPPDETPTPTVAITPTDTPTLPPPTTNTPSNTPTIGPTGTPTGIPTVQFSPTHTPTPTRTAFPPRAPTKTRTPTVTGTPPTPVPTASTCYSYGITVGVGTIVPASTLVPGSNCDDCVVEVDASALGFYFPFYDLYESFRGPKANPAGPPIMRRMRMGSNGTLELLATATFEASSAGEKASGTTGKSTVGAPDATDINSCLPAPDAAYTIFPHWDDLRTDCPGCGIFTNVTGTPGSRIFDIEWRAEYYLCGGRVNVQLRLYETTGDFEVIYGQVDQSGSRTTVGVQRDPGAFTQYACNVVGSLNPGMRLRFTRQSCGAATPTPTASVTGTPPTMTATPTRVVVCDPLPTPTACPVKFSDVLPWSTFYAYIRCLACRGIVNGYPDNTFRPGNSVTRGQLSKIVSNAAGFLDPSGVWRFEDVPPGSTFYDFVQRLANRGYIGGYPCGGEGEPCVLPANRPYFRVGNTATRGHISKIVSNAAGFTEPAGAWRFEDVPPGSTFYDFIERLASRGYIQGYPCGGPGEPCVLPGNRPYFRVGSNATRGQTAKIVSNTFFPGCYTPASRSSQER